MNYRGNVTVPALADLLGMSRNALYDAIARGEIRATRVGRKITIPAYERDRLLCLDPPAEPAAKAA